MYQVLRHEAEADWIDISHRAFLDELCAEGCADPYLVANRLRTGPMLVTQLARYRWAGVIAGSVKAKGGVAGAVPSREPLQATLCSHWGIASNSRAIPTDASLSAGYQAERADCPKLDPRGTLNAYSVPTTTRPEQADLTVSSAPRIGVVACAGRFCGKRNKPWRLSSSL
jgi:hypothetical protein